MEFSVRAAELTTLLESRISNFYTNLKVDEIGRVVSVGDGIARVYGLNEIQAGEMVAFSSGVKGIALNLENENEKKDENDKDCIGPKDLYPGEGGGKLPSIKSPLDQFGSDLDAATQALLNRGARLIYFFRVNPEWVRYVVYIIWVVGYTLSGESAACDGIGGVEGPPSPPVVWIHEAPEVPTAPPEIPVLNQPLLADIERERELYRRFLVNTIGEEPSLRRISDTISVQSMIERRVEAALVHHGFDPRSIILNRHELRGILFYPRGRALSVRSYRSYLRDIERLGTIETRAFQRILRSIRDFYLFL
ncbi:hypothetical protein OROGR_034174 [Orobanche gracilis]